MGMASLTGATAAEPLVRLCRPLWGDLLLRVLTGVSCVDVCCGFAVRSRVYLVFAEHSSSVPVDRLTVSRVNVVEHDFQRNMYTLIDVSATDAVATTTTTTPLSCKVSHLLDLYALVVLRRYSNPDCSSNILSRQEGVALQSAGDHASVLRRTLGTLWMKRISTSPCRGIHGGEEY